MKTKVHEREMKAVNDQMSRFALYDDYKDLYDRVVPPVVSVQEDVGKMSQ